MQTEGRDRTRKAGESSRRENKVSLSLSLSLVPPQCLSLSYSSLSLLLSSLSISLSLSLSPLDYARDPTHPVVAGADEIGLDDVPANVQAVGQELERVGDSVRGLHALVLWEGRGEDRQRRKGKREIKRYEEIAQSLPGSRVLLSLSLSLSFGLSLSLSLSLSLPFCV